MKDSIIGFAAKFRVTVVLLLSQYGMAIVVGTITGATAVVGLFLFGHPVRPPFFSLVLAYSVVALMLAAASFYLINSDTLASPQQLEAALQCLRHCNSGQRQLRQMIARQQGRVLRSQLERICRRFVAR